jgi:hypothetical protein
MKTKALGWKLHGELPDSESKLSALLTPGVHNLFGDADSGKTAAVAALAVALAAGRAGAPDGFFGQALASPVGVAIIPNQRHAARVGPMVEAAAFARGITTALPVGVGQPQPGGVGAMVGTTYHLHELRAALPAPLRLVILDEIEESESTRGRAAAENIVDTLGCAALIVSRRPFGVAGVKLEIAGGALSYRETDGLGWRRALSFDTAALAGHDMPVVRAGKALSFTRVMGDPTPPPPLAQRGDEPKIAEKMVVFGTGREITQAERDAWQGYTVARNASDAVPSRETAPTQGVRLIEIVPNDRDGRQENARRTESHLRALADSRGVGQRVVTRISPRTIAA